MERKTAKRWVVRGSVQGVGFRFFVQHKASSLGVNGWARNLDDGSVEVYGIGSQSQLSDLGAALHKGPSQAQVRGVEEQDALLESFSGFSIR